MPIIKSAKKRMRVIRKATARNANTRRSIKTAIKSFNRDLSSGKKTASGSYSKAQSEIDKAGKKHVLHKNKVARKQSQLAASAKSAGIPVHNKNRAVKSPAPKTTAKTTSTAKSKSATGTKKSAPKKK